VVRTTEASGRYSYYLSLSIYIYIYIERERERESFPVGSDVNLLAVW